MKPSKERLATRDKLLRQSSTTEEQEKFGFGEL
jgi:hypothetical protein